MHSRERRQVQCRLCQPARLGTRQPLAPGIEGWSGNKKIGAILLQSPADRCQSSLKVLVHKIIAADDGGNDACFSLPMLL
jgi:hypothetical protein